MTEGKKCGFSCPLCGSFGIINVLGEKWTICILLILRKDKKTRFNEIKRNIKEINPKTLSKRLKELGKLGLVERKIKSEKRPPEVSYVLSEKGKQLIENINPLVNWIIELESEEED